MHDNSQTSRYEVNRKVRIVITRHDGDLTRIDYSFLGKTVYLSGELTKPDRDFSAHEIETIATDILAIPDVVDIIFDLNNWLVESSGDSWQVKPLRQTGRLVYESGSSGASDDATIVIKQAEELRTVLDDMKKTNLNKKE
jgi:hypothetical protein